MLSVSVVVPIRNAIRTLPYCLAALERLDPLPEEIVLVNNGSTDGSAELLRDFARRHASRGVHVADEPRRGISRARNAGIRVARGDVIAWTDADCAPAPTWLRHLVPPFADPAVGGVAGRVLPAPGISLVELFCGLYTFRTPDRPARHGKWTPREGGYAGANFAVRRAILQELGGYDEHIMNWGDDYDLCARLYERGLAIEYRPESQVYHYHRARLIHMLRQAFGQGRSHPYLLRRHTRTGLWIDLPRHPVTWTGCPIPAWVDIASADKKLVAILLLGAAYGPALGLLPLYATWLAVAAARQARKVEQPVTPLAALGLAGLLLLKSAAMTAGRWWGSVKYGAICL